MTRSVDLCVKTGEQSSDDPYKFVMSSESKDRVGDVIRQDGWELTQFKKNPIALFGHSHGFPIGTWKNVRIEGKRLVGDLKMAAAGTSQRIDEIRSLLEQRILKAVSVGFRIKEYQPIDEKDPWGAWDITKAELLETSVVSVPANQDAVMLAKSMGISQRTLDIAFAPQGDQPETGLKATVSPRDYSELLGASSLDIRAARSGFIQE